MEWGFTGWSQGEHVPAVHLTSNPTFRAVFSWPSVFKGHYHKYQRFGGRFCPLLLFFKSLGHEWRTAQSWVMAADHLQRHSDHLTERSPSLPNIWVTDTLSARHGHEQLYRNSHSKSWWLTAREAQGYWKIILEQCGHMGTWFRHMPCGDSSVT